MITGFNTDVKHKNRVFHIQTEDKGDANPYVESLVYVGGEILATKKTSYAAVLEEGRDDHAVQDLMEQQHRTMIAAIQRGRFDGPGGSIQIPEGMAPTAPSEAALKPPLGDAPAAAVQAAAAAEQADSTAPPGAVTPAATAKPPGTSATPPASDRSLDEMVLSYLTSDDVPDEVVLTLSPTPEFLSGRPVQTRLKAATGSPARALVGAHVQVRILSTSARASTVFQGKTASDGSCPISFMIPAHSNGTAAAVIRVTAPNASAEIQYPIRKK